MRLLVVCLAAVLFVAPPAPLTVSAAISLTDALEVLGPLYTAQGGAPVRFNFGGSNALARQIVRGAPVDVFISADEAQMDLAAASGAIRQDTRVALLGNRLAVFVHPDTRLQLNRIEDLTRAGVRRVAVGDTAAVPAGVYAREYLQQRGVWEALRPRLVPVSHVRAAITAVEHGGADAALAYQSDAARSSARLAFVIDDPAAPRIVYPAALVASSRAPAEGARFLAFICSGAAADVFARYEFIPLRCR